MAAVKSLPGGAWPTMITLFKDDNSLDLENLERLVDWYVDHGVSGIFAVCQSSEMFHLSLEERVRLARLTVETAAGRVPVIASGHVSDGEDAQVAELEAMMETGIDSLILITNRLGGPETPEDAWKKNLDRLIGRLETAMPLGLYECPFPSKRLLSPAEVKHCAETGRFVFFKDTCCSDEGIRQKIVAAAGSPLKIYNANAAFLLKSLRHGAAGYNGVMANFHPELYDWLCAHYQEPDAERVADALGILSCIEARAYPVSAKYHVSRFLPGAGLHTRTRPQEDLSESFREEVEQVDRVAKRLYQELAIPVGNFAKG